MDKRYTALTLQQQLELRRQAVEDVLANPQWSLPEAIRHLKTTMRITTSELARLSGLGFRTLQDIERERSEGSVQTMNRVFSILGLKLGVVRHFPASDAQVQSEQEQEQEQEATRLLQQSRSAVMKVGPTAY